MDFEVGSGWCYQSWHYHRNLPSTEKEGEREVGAEAQVFYHHHVDTEKELGGGVFSMIVNESARSNRRQRTGKAKSQSET